MNWRQFGGCLYVPPCKFQILVQVIFLNCGTIKIFYFRNKKQLTRFLVKMHAPKFQRFFFHFKKLCKQSLLWLYQSTVIQLGCSSSVMLVHVCYSPSPPGRSHINEMASHNKLFEHYATVLKERVFFLSHMCLIYSFG